MVSVVGGGGGGGGGGGLTGSFSHDMKQVVDQALNSGPQIVCSYIS